MTIAIYGSRQFAEYADPMTQFLDAMASNNVEIVMHRKIYNILLHLMPLKLSAVRKVVDTPDFSADLALSIGGDGTFLRTAMWVGDKQIPILGLNAGHLGYLSGASIADLPSLTSVILSGDYHIEQRSLIHVAAPSLPFWPYALNEAAVSKEASASMIVASTKINGTHLADYRADGLLVSTPTGSTAYNLSVGGPIIQPSAPVWTLTPIACHSLGMRPLVVRDDSEISIIVDGRSSTYRLTLDGRACSIDCDTEIRIKKADFPICVVSLRGYTFSNALREKLHWSE